MILPALLLPKAVADAITSCGSQWGAIDLKQDRAEDLLIVSGWRKGLEYGGKVIEDRHYTRYATSVPGAGWWYEVEPSLHELGRFRRLRGGGVAAEELAAGVLNGWKKPSTAGTHIVTFARRAGGLPPDWCAWTLVKDSAIQLDLDIFDAGADLLAPLDRGWRRDQLSDLHVTVVGLGSIGSVACEALASYGLRKFTLVDFDRLRAHNFARHRTLREEHGRLKVNAVADLLKRRDPTVEVEPLPLDVASNADQIRPILDETDLVTGCPDGTRARRTTSHLAYWAGKPVVLACVLEQGAFGEVLRLLPGRTGCLLCNRAALKDAFDPEPGLDAGYETGNPHLPMNAVTGDLALVGQLAAKAAVATLLERRGDRAQRLAGDHGIVSLRPVPDFPEPFDFSEAGEMRWRPTAASRQECPTCGGST
jgi:molybdopterin-synthase adenylyltransferase